MQTKFFEIKNITDESNQEKIEQVAEILKNGGTVAIPTETVYGLAANALDETTVEKIFKAKGRPSDNPLILHISEISQWYDLVEEVPPLALELAEKFWPNSLTIILKKSDKVPSAVCGGLDTVAVRMPDNDVTRQIISKSNCPLAAPSANTSGKPSPTTAMHVKHDLDGKINAIVDGGACEIGVESTVVTLATNPPRLLRPGAITAEMLREVLPDLVVDDAVLSKLAEGKKAASPGMKYKHYSPKAQVIILKGDLEKFAQYLDENANKNDVALCFENEEKVFNINSIIYGKLDDSLSQANGIFDALRKVDEMNFERAFARYPTDDGVGLAVFNRMLRAAEFNVIEL